MADSMTGSSCSTRLVTQCLENRGTLRGRKVLELPQLLGRLGMHGGHQPAGGQTGQTDLFECTEDVTHESVSSLFSTL